MNKWHTSDDEGKNESGNYAYRLSLGFFQEKQRFIYLNSIYIYNYIKCNLSLSWMFSVFFNSSFRDRNKSQDQKPFEWQFIISTSPRGHIILAKISSTGKEISWSKSLYINYQFNLFQPIYATDYESATHN